MFAAACLGLPGKHVSISLLQVSGVVDVSIVHRVFDVISDDIQVKARFENLLAQLTVISFC